MRQDSTRAAIGRYKAAVLRGDFSPLEEYDGFSPPYSDLVLALYHGYFPFSFSTYNAKQTSRLLQDKVVAHPWILSNATEAQAGEVYQCECQPSMYHIMWHIMQCVCIDCGTQTCFCSDT